MYELPVEVIGLLTIGVGFLVAQGVKGILAVFGKDLGGKAAAFTAVAVAALIFFIEGVIGVFPPESQEAIAKGIQALALVLGMFGTHKTYKGLSGG